MRTRLVPILPYLVMLGVAVTLWVWISGISFDTGGGRRIGPDFWPKAIIVFLGLLCAWEIVRRLVSPGVVAPAPAESAAASSASPAATVPPDAAAEPPLDNRKLVAGLLLVGGYVLCVPWLGFFATTVLFLAFFTWIGGTRRPLLAASVGLAGGLALVVLFMRIAYISLPLGEGPFRALSLWLLKTIGVS